MASEVAELSSINDEDLLRRMWQQSEDFGRKKEIRAHMYKLREERLRNFYTGDMDGIGSMSKSPMVPSHGDSLADQSFQSFKAKEIRDSESPTRHMKYGPPDTSGWNVITSSEISSDGKEQINSTLATTDAIKDVPGGKSSFSGKNEQVDTHRHDGDDKNYKSTSGRTSNTVLKEHVIVGDANNGRTESTSNTTSSSTKIITSSKYHSDNIANDDLVQEFEDVLNSAKRSVRENANKSNVKNEKFERIPCNDFDKECFNISKNNSKTTNKSVNQSNQQSSYEIRRNSVSSTTSSVDAKKIQRETEYLANAPGQLISRSVEYPDPNTKVITETKTLPDGSTVTTTKYETRAASTSTSSRASKQEKSSTSRTITEDKAERNRIEVIVGDNKNVVEEVLNSRHVIDDNQKPERKEIIYDISVTQDLQRNAKDRKDISHQENSRQETSHQENIRKETSHQENLRKETSHQENTPKETSHQEHTRQETNRLENARQQNVNEENVRRTHVQHHQTNESRPVKVSEDYIQEKMHHEDVFSKKVNENVSSHERYNLDKEQNENLIKRVEVNINTERPTDFNKKDRNSQSSEIIDDKVSTERHKTVKKDLSQDHEDYVQSRIYQDDQYDRKPVQEEIIVPKKQVIHICSPNHDHSAKPQPKPDYSSKRISVDHNPSHEAFARSLRCVTPEKDAKRSVQSSTQSVKSNYTYTDHGRRSPSRDTNISDTSKFSTSTVTKSRRSHETPHSPIRKPSPDKRKPTVENMSSAISSETIDIITSESEQKHSKRTESTRTKSSQNNVSTKQTTIRKSEDHYDYPRNNQTVHPKSTAPTDDSTYYDIPRNNTPVQPQDGPNRKSSSDQPSYLRPTASSARHNTKTDYVDGTKSKKQTKDNQEPIYDTISDRPSNSRRQPLKTDSMPTYTSSVIRENDDYRNFKKSLRKQTAHQPDYEPEFDSGRSNSPTSSVSDIEYVNFSNNTKKVTDLDSEHSDVEKITTRKVTSENTETRNEDTQDGLMFSTHKKKASSPSLESDTDTIIGHDDQPKEPFYLVDNQKEKTPENDDKATKTRKEKPPLTRSETYEERCRSMLGMMSETDDLVNEQKSTTTSKTKSSKETSIDFINSERNVENVRRSVTISPDRKSVTISPDRKSVTVSPDRKSVTVSPDRKSVTNQLDKNTERSPSRSPDRKKTIFLKSSNDTTSTKHAEETEDNRFDTFSLKKNKSPKRTPQSSPERKEDLQSKQPVTDQKPKNSSKTIHVKNSSFCRQQS